MLEYPWGAGLLPFYLSFFILGVRFFLVIFVCHFVCHYFSRGFMLLVSTHQG